MRKLLLGSGGVQHREMADLLGKFNNVNLVFFSIFLLTVCFLYPACQEKKRPELAEQVDFNFHIKPILVQKCYLCHGPDPSSREAGLRLDIEEGAFSILESGNTAIHPGSLQKSALVGRITQTDPELMMPPPSSNLELSEKEINLLKKWIKQGAAYKEHWAFIPPVRPETAPDESTSEVIDRLLKEKVDAHQLTVSPEADKYTLIRRLSYVLTGLPPKPEEVKAFVENKGYNAYEKLVDHYLASPAYGERWARHWMDVVRYAETKGHEFDFMIHGAWQFRDYLIRAFNKDLPYDQLVKEHLAGDLLAFPRYHPEKGFNESILGTMFLTMAEGTHSPVDIRKDETDRIDNMIDVTGKGLQGLTIACSKCHDHKFDPIPTKDYYGLYGIMESTRFTPVPLSEERKKTINLEDARKIKNYIRVSLAALWDSADAQKLPFQLAANFEKKDKKTATNYKILGDFRGQDLQGWKADGHAFGVSTTLGDPVFKKDKPELEYLNQGMASSRKFKTGIFGALRSSDFTIGEQFVGVKARGSGGSIRIIIDNFQLISYPIYGGMDQKVNNPEWSQFVFDVGDWKGHKAYIEVLPGAYRNHVYQQREEDYIEVEYAIAYEEEWQEPLLPGKTANTSLITAVANWKNQHSAIEEVHHLNTMLAENRLARSFPEMEKSIFQEKLVLAPIRDSVFFNGVTEGTGRESPVFIRGSHLDLEKDKVPRAFLPKILDYQGLYSIKGSGRMEMTTAILSPENPLTARVMVNRIWHHVFGRGIVESVDNFGLQGKLPSHSELLDYLALSFVEGDWSIKKMIRAMVLTDAFRRSTQALDPEADIENRYLARYPVRRLEAEAIRDGMLAVASSLDPTMYGSSVPVHLTDFMQGRGRPQLSGPVDGNGRRSIYLEVRRNFLDGMMMAFDRPTPFSTFGKRDVTNVPAQSLFLMNDPFVILQAGNMAVHLINNRQEDTLEDRIKFIYLNAFSRLPEQDELGHAINFIQTLAIEYKVSSDEIMEHADLWKDYCHSIFNMKEFIYLL
ncbi:PSD1 and planctomycete cytochrome C domain-containing protein [Negadavirga shengliensis]|uniref:PSD1 and planctomycete cytochrome C domain-containing protein n=1 Tax=Negadavirga shengliensis TaxID=1389218 RepID=A0ABV9SZH4_9BACT